jgi:hypothetical protein
MKKVRLNCHFSVRLRPASASVPLRAAAAFPILRAECMSEY